MAYHKLTGFLSCRYQSEQALDKSLLSLRKTIHAIFLAKCGTPGILNKKRLQDSKINTLPGALHDTYPGCT